MSANTTKTSSGGQAIDSELIDKKELRRRLNLTSVRMVEEMMRQRKIPYVRLGYRTVRFSWPKVLAAIARLEHRAIGDRARRIWRERKPGTTVWGAWIVEAACRLAVESRRSVGGLVSGFCRSRGPGVIDLPAQSSREA